MGGGRLREVIAHGGSTVLHSGFKPHSYVRTFTFYGFVHLRHLLVLSAGYWRRKKRQQWS